LTQRQPVPHARPPAVPGVRAFGVMAFYGKLISFAVAVLPDHPASSPGPALFLYSIVLGVSFVALGKRPREKQSGSRLQDAPGQIEREIEREKEVLLLPLCRAIRRRRP